MPAGVVTVIVPLVVPAATTAVICVSLSTVNDCAAVPLNATDEALVKLRPVMTTLVPARTFEGVKLAMLGPTRKLVDEVAVPFGAVTEMVPLVVPTATTARICVALSMMNDAAGVPLNDTAVAPVKFVPVSVTVVPLPPLAGVKLVKVGPV